jgi:predicted DNA-binding transcriptional regulator AlpA
MSNDPPTVPGDVLTVEQFADKLQVSRATVFAWIQKNILKQGQHFFKIGRVVRFVWNADAIRELLQVSPPVAVVSSPPLLATKRKANRINWDY